MFVPYKGFVARYTTVY